MYVVAQGHLHASQNHNAPLKSTIADLVIAFFCVVDVCRYTSMSLRDTYRLLKITIPLKSTIADLAVAFFCVVDICSPGTQRLLKITMLS